MRVMAWPEGGDGEDFEAVFEGVEAVADKDGVGDHDFAVGALTRRSTAGPAKTPWVAATWMSPQP